MPPETGPLLGPHVVGRRVVVRRLVHGETGPSGGPAMTDLLGECLAWGDGEVVVRRENGEVVTVPIADVVAGKPVPPRPTRHNRLGDEEADRAALPGWSPVESEPLGDWLLRASGGFSSRGNSVLALGDPGVPVSEAVPRVARWYAERGLEPRAHVHPGSPQGEAFEAAGWERYESTRLMLASASKVLRRADRPAAEVELRERVDDAWLATDPRAEKHAEAARAVLEQGDVTFAIVHDDTGVLARGRGARHGDWVGLASLWTREDARGGGLGSAVVRALVEWGAEHGATSAYLQVVVANDRAAALYERHGFEEHHRYDYLLG